MKKETNTIKPKGLNVSIKDLRKLLKELENMRIKDAKHSNLPVFPISTKILIPIINKKGYSDTWELL